VNVLRCSSADAARMIGPCDLVMIDATITTSPWAADIALWKPHIKSANTGRRSYSERDLSRGVRAVKRRFSGHVNDVRRGLLRAAGAPISAATRSEG